jgi:hypothetical protein
MNQAIPVSTRPRFELGRVMITPAASAALEAAKVPTILLLARHVHGDWGEVDEHDRLQNEMAVSQGMRVLSSYPLSADTKLWGITEADRSATTILLPDEY